MYKKPSYFVLHIRPWIFFAAGILFSLISAYIAGQSLEKAANWRMINTILLYLFGLAIGFPSILATNKLHHVRSEYLSLKNVLFITWYLSSFVVLTIAEANWIYFVCLPVSSFYIGYIGLYIPRYIRIKEEQIRFYEERSGSH